MKRIQQYIERNTSQKAIALQVFSGAVSSGIGILKACDLAATCSCFCARTIRRWAVDIFLDYFSLESNIDDITVERLEMELSSSRGKHIKWKSLMHDENFRCEAKQYVLDNGYIKGKPNLTLQQFVDWVKEEKDTEVSITTVSVWLHDLGFSYKQFSKGVYFDGHERTDVVADKKAYLEMLASYDGRMWVSHSPAPDPNLSPVIRVFHDESTF